MRVSKARSYISEVVVIESDHAAVTLNSRQGSLRDEFIVHDILSAVGCFTLDEYISKGLMKKILPRSSMVGIPKKFKISRGRMSQIWEYAKRVAVIEKSRYASMSRPGYLERMIDSKKEEIKCDKERSERLRHKNIKKVLEYVEAENSRLEREIERIDSLVKRGSHDNS